MKLTRTNLIETIRRKNEGWTTYQARKIAGITIRRVNQVWNQYCHTGEIPAIGIKNGRPQKPFEEWELQIVKEAYSKYRVSADTLERLIERDYGKHMGHNRVHKILLKLGFARRKPSKDIRKKKWKMYERRHSLTAVHIDWHNSGKYWAFGVEDDASREILSLVECSNATTEKSIEGMEEALAYGSIKQCISDHGTQFVKSISEKDSRFAVFLKKNGMKQILCKVKHPQSNGKIERWFEVYDRHRGAFRNREEFLHWYNVLRPHRSLNFDVLETPEVAFIRKMRRMV